MFLRDDFQYFEGRAAKEFELAKASHDRSARAVHLKFAKCYHDLARAIDKRDKIHASVAALGGLH